MPDPEKSKIKESFERLINLQYEHGQQTDYNINNNNNDRPKSANGYDFYFPSPEDVAEYKAGSGDKDIYLIDLQPPPKSNEPNYYAVKPKKGTKKYIPYKKHVNYKNIDEKRTILSEPITRSSFPDTEVIKTISNSKKRSELDTTNAEFQQENDQKNQKIEKQLEFNLGEYLPSPLRRNAENGERVEFQMHGFNGPNSYKFGYDTGKG